MGIGEAIGYGLLGALGGGAKVIQDQEKDSRENAQKMAMEQQKTDRELAIEEQKLRMKAQFEKDNLPNELEKIKAKSQAEREADPALAELRQAQADKARNDVQRDKESRATEKQIEKKRQSLAKAKTLARNDPSLQSIVDARQEELDTLLGSRTRNDPLSSGVSAAKAVLNDPEASDVQKENARNFLSNALQGQGHPQTKDKFTVGKQYRDAQGNTKTYLGNGQWG